MSLKTDLQDVRSVIFSCSGTELTDAERDFFKMEKPFGFILFARNIDNPDQVKKLIGELRDCVEREDAPVLVDQEGGRVQRLRTPYWFTAPSFGKIGSLYAQDADKGRYAASLSTKLIAHDLLNCGFSVNCSPCLDINRSQTSNVIGDRSFGSDIHMITDLASVVADTYLKCGIMPVIKHMPGHGWGAVDSHHELPTVSVALSELKTSDFVPFRKLANLPWGMTAHIVFDQLDADYPATQSHKIITEVIRGDIGFDGLLLTDDLNMNALEGDLGTRAKRAVEGGVDIVLHCSGVLSEMMEVAPHCPALSEKSRVRISVGKAQLDHHVIEDSAELIAELSNLIELS